MRPRLSVRAALLLASASDSAGQHRACGPAQFVFREPLPDLCDALEPGALIVDVGLHTESSFFACPAEKQRGVGFIGFEANPWACAAFKAAVRRNAFDSVDIRCQAVADAPGRALLHVPRGPGGAARSTLAAAVPSALGLASLAVQN